MSRQKSKPNGSDPTHGKKPRSHRVRHPKEPAASGNGQPVNPGTQEPRNPIAQAAEVLAQEQAAKPIPPGVSDDDRDKLRAAETKIEQAERDLVNASRRRKEAQEALDTALGELRTISREIATGTGQPRLQFDAPTQERDRAAMLADDKAAAVTATPKLLERLRIIRYVVTPEQLDALTHDERHALAEFTRRTEAAVLDRSQLVGLETPKVLAAMHVAGVDVTDSSGHAQQCCTLCGMMLRWKPRTPPLNDAGEPIPFEGWLEPGIRVGQDCAGVDVADEREALTEPADDEAALEEQLH